MGVLFVWRGVCQPSNRHQSTPSVSIWRVPSRRRDCQRKRRAQIPVAADQKCWRISEAGLRPKKTPAYFLWLARENWEKLTAASVAGVGSWSILKHYNSGGFGGGKGGHGGRGNSGSGGGNNGGGSPSDGLQAGRLTEEERKFNSTRPVHLTLVSFAVTRKAYEVITERFAEEYEAATGIPVKFRLSFGGSGTQARAVVDGLPGDIVALALPLDIMKIQEAGLIKDGWQERAPNNAVVAQSVVALVTRQGNPKSIQDWHDLTREDVDVITANPKTAGVARWNFLALWGHLMDQGDEAAQRFVTRVFHRVPIQPRDAREASEVFYNQHQGDVLLNYENEVIMTNISYADTNQEEKVLPYVVPQNNVKIETPVALVDRNLDRRPPATREKTRACATAFVHYLFTPEAQREFAACGFRVSDPQLSTLKMPKVRKVWSVDDKLGGWNPTQKKFFSSGGILDQIQHEVGAFKQQQRSKRR